MLVVENLLMNEVMSYIVLYRLVWTSVCTGGTISGGVWKVWLHLAGYVPWIDMKVGHEPWVLWSQRKCNQGIFDLVFYFHWKRKDED